MEFIKQMRGVYLGGLLLGLLAIGCGAPDEPTAATSAGALSSGDPTAPFTAPTRTLSSFGAVGDGTTDDTAAVRAAFDAATDFCLDGENKTYRVVGTSRADHRFCLQNANFRQTISAFNTRPYIKSATPENLAAIGNHMGPSQVITYACDGTPKPCDPVLSEQAHSDFELRNNLRTIFVTAQGGAIYLKNVHVSKGEHETLGNGGNASAIYLVGSPSVTIDDVEISGKGRGYGLSIYSSHNIKITALNIHDITWSLDLGDRAFTLADFKDRYVWNNVPIYQYEPKAKRYTVVRSQEQASGLVISDCSNIDVQNSRVSEIVFRLGNLLLPWQSDGVTVTESQNLSINGMEIAQTWEGVDLSGGDTPDKAVQNFTLQNIAVQDSFGFGLKVAHAARSGKILNSTVVYSGIAGVVFSGPGADFIVSGMNVLETGVVRSKDGTVFVNPWLSKTTAGVLVLTSGGSREMDPQHVRVVNSNFANTNHAKAMHYGVYGARTNLIHFVGGNLDVTGAKIEGSRNLIPTTYTYTDVVTNFRSVFGCDGALTDIIRIWDQSSDAVRNPPWSLPQMRFNLSTEKRNGTLKCP